MMVKLVDGKQKFDELYDVMAESFPYGERRDKISARKLADDGRYCLKGIEVDGVLAGVLGFWNFSECVFIEHLALRPIYRNKGISSVLLKDFLKDVSTCVLEVEKPDTEIAKRRIEFYKRLDFCVNDYAYSQPSYHNDGQKIPMLMLSFPAKLKPSEFGAVTRELYKNVYGQID